MWCGEDFQGLGDGDKSEKGHGELGKILQEVSDIKQHVSSVGWEELGFQERMVLGFKPFPNSRVGSEQETWFPPSFQNSILRTVDLELDSYPNSLYLIGTCWIHTNYVYL